MGFHPNLTTAFFFHPPRSSFSPNKSPSSLLPSTHSHIQVLMTACWTCLTELSPLIHPFLPLLQVLMTACWTSLKEVTLVVGALSQEVPLPSGPPQQHAEGGNSYDDDGASVGDGHSVNGDGDAASEGGGAGERGIISAAQLRRMGDLLLRLLFEVKHSGAVEKAGIGLGALAGRLLR